jgi:hypothetical protein
MRPVRKALWGCLFSCIVLCSLEGLGWLYACTVADVRVPPLPEHPKYDVLCTWGEMSRLCPDQGPAYERVRPEVFTSIPTQPRIIFIGESFVYGLGISAEESFPKQVGDLLGVEALNFGRCGTYASRLIPIVLEAVSLKPDLIVLATGNNEHTMTSFFQGPWGRRPLRNYKILRFFGQFQLYGGLSHLMGTADVRIVETFDRVEQHLTADIDKKVFAARRRPPYLSVFSDGLARHDVRAVLEEEQRLKELIFTDQLQLLVDIVLDNDVPLLLTTLPQEAFVPPALSGTQKKEIEAVLEAVRKLDYKEGLSLDPSVALFHFEQAQSLWRSGDKKKAMKAYEQSVSLDLVPDSTPEINDIIRDIAQKNNVPLVDLRTRAWEYAGNPRAFFLDSVHLNAKGAHVVGAWLSVEIKRLYPERFGE